MLDLILSALGLSRLKALAFLLAAAAVVTGLGVLYAKAYRAGEARITNQIDRQNEEAGHVAVQARDAVRKCFAVGGVWNDGTGHCERRMPPVPGAD